MRFSKGLIALFVGLLLSTSSAFALDSATLDRWIGSMGELQKWSDDNGEQLLAQDAADEHGRFDFNKSMQQAADQFPEVGAIIDRHGFDSIRDWASSTNRIFNAFAKLKMEEAAPRIEAQLQAMERDLDDPEIDPEQRQITLGEINEQRQSMRDFGKNVPQDDLQTVREREQDLDAMFKG